MTPNGMPTPKPTFSAESDRGPAVADTTGVGRPAELAAFADARVRAEVRLVLDVAAPVGEIVEDGRVAEVLELLVEIRDDVGLEEAVVDVTPMVVRMVGVPKNESVLLPLSQSQPEPSIQQ